MLSASDNILFGIALCKYDVFNLPPKEAGSGSATGICCVTNANIDALGLLLIKLLF